MESKWIFGIATVLGLCAVQITAFILGIDGVVFAGTTGIITAIVGFLFGLNLTTPKKKVDIITEYINATKPKT